MDSLFIVTPIVRVCNCSMFCCTLLYAHSSFATILMGKRELVALLGVPCWCLVIVVKQHCFASLRTGKMHLIRHVCMSHPGGPVKST